ncbi:MAG: hypothetical protein WBO97_07780 [Tepidiformaceae bacterium]
MYAIRVRVDGNVLEAAFSGLVTTEEALRAVSQAFVLAEAANISRAVCDLRGVDEGLSPGSISIIAASFSARFHPGQRIAILCTPAQLPVARRFARFAQIGEGFGVFTREADAETWLQRAPSHRISETMLRHMRAIVQDEPPAEDGIRRHSA